VPARTLRDVIVTAAALTSIFAAAHRRPKKIGGGAA